MTREYADSRPETGERNGMNIIRYLYVELNADRAVATKSFDTRPEAVSHAAQRLKSSISEVLGSDFAIPEDHIDDDGNIWYCNGEAEIYSSGYEWSIWKSGCDTARASVEEQVIELSPAEMLSLYGLQMNEFLVEDAERQLRDYVEYGFASIDCAGFPEDCGFTIDQATDRGSEHYLLDSIVERYSDAYDCSIAENDLWYNAIEYVLKSHLAMAKTI